MCGTTLFAFEFMHFTQTRIATIDTYGVLFILLSFLVDVALDLGPLCPYVKEKPGWILFLCGLSFGLGCACKWTVLYAGVGLAALWLLRVIMKYRAVGLEHYGKELLGTIGLSVVFFLVIPAIIYCLSYIPYGLALGYQLPSMLTDKNYYKIIWDNQVYMLTYHSGVDQSHPYSSRWCQWLFDVRPILYYLNYSGSTKVRIRRVQLPADLLGRSSGPGFQCSGILEAAEAPGDFDLGRISVPVPALGVHHPHHVCLSLLWLHSVPDHRHQLCI